MNDNLRKAALEVSRKADAGEELSEYDLAVYKLALLARIKEVAG